MLLAVLINACLMAKVSCMVMKDCVQKGELVREEMKVIMEWMTG